MGNRSQVCIKKGKGRVYLYSHWGGTEVYAAAAQAVKDVPGRHSDADYFARAVFCRMISGEDLLGETGYGIGAEQHGDIDHAIPVFDCDTGKVWFEKAEYGEAPPKKKMTFEEFASGVKAGKFKNL